MLIPNIIPLFFQLNCVNRLTITLISSDVAVAIGLGTTFRKPLYYVLEIG